MRLSTRSTTTSAVPRIESRQIVTILGVEKIAGLAGLCSLERPRADARNELAIDGQRIALDDRAADDRDVQLACGLVELGRLIRRRGNSRQRIRATIGSRRRRITLLNADQDVVQTDGV